MAIADRRERLTESLAALAFLAAAAAMALALPGEPLPAQTAIWLVALFCVLHQVEFDVGEGRTRPIQLVLVPMLLLLPPATVPALIAVALVCARLPAVVARRERAESLPLALADGWFSVAPALVLALTGLPDEPWAARRRARAGPRRPARPRLRQRRAPAAPSASGCASASSSAGSRGSTSSTCC